MKQTIEIEVPEGFEAKYNPIQNKIELIKKDTKSRSWEEYCAKHPFTGKEICITWDTHKTCMKKGFRRSLDCVEYASSEEEAKAFIALMKLRQLREEWIGDWRPNWTNGSEKCCIYYYEEQIKTGVFCNAVCSMSFPTLKMANEFLDCFKDLLEEAKPLL